MCNTTNQQKGAGVPDLSGYRVVYPASASPAFVQQITTLAERLSRMTGETLVAYPDTEAACEREILVGDVDRPEVARARESISGYGYTILASGDKLILAGSNAFAAVLALRHFINEYLNGNEPFDKLYRGVVVDHIATMELDASFTIVYNSRLWTSTDHTSTDQNRETVYGPINSNGTGRDYTYDAVLMIKEKLCALTGALDVALAEDTSAACEREILVGLPERDCMAHALRELAPDQYGILVRNGKLFVTGYSIEAMRVATPLLLGFLEDARLGDGRIVLPCDLTIIDTANKGWFTDFPRPEGLALYNAQDVGDGCFEYLYMGKDVTEAAYDAYCRTLLEAGFSVLTESEMEGSRFTTFTDAGDKRMLYVAYNAFTHADEQPPVCEKDFPASWHLFKESKYAFTEPQLRIVSANVNYKNPAHPRPAAPLLMYAQSAPASDTVAYVYFNKNSASEYTEGVSFATYFWGEYRTALEQDGYRVLFESRVGDVPFLTAVNDCTGAQLKAELHENGLLTVGGEKRVWAHIRLLFKKRGLASLADRKDLTPDQTYTKVTESKIIPVFLAPGAVGTCYIVQLEDGRFIVSDGGRGGAGENDSPQRLYAIMESLYRKSFHRDPSPEHPIEIAAWIVTHGHTDHMDCFWDFSNYYGGGNGGHKIKDGGLVRLQYFIANVPELSTTYNTGETSMALRYEMKKFQDYFKHGFTHLTPHTGQKLYFGNLELSVMFTQEDLNPQHIVNFNDTSTVIRFSLYGSEHSIGERVTLTGDVWSGGKAAHPNLTTMMSTGDAYIHGGRWMCAMYGSALKSDMVTVSHHGGAGLEKAFYAFVSPRAVLWPHLRSGLFYTAPTSPGYLTMNNWYGKVGQYMVLGMDSVDYVFIADLYHLGIEATPSGPRFEELADVCTGERVSEELMYTLPKSLRDNLGVLGRPDKKPDHEQYGPLHEIHEKRPLIILKK